jgi:hypothetical protein
MDMEMINSSAQQLAEMDAVDHHLNDNSLTVLGVNSHPNPQDNTPRTPQDLSTQDANTQNNHTKANSKATIITKPITPHLAARPEAHHEDQTVLPQTACKAHQ